MKLFQLLIQSLWLAFLVYFMLERSSIQATLGDNFGWAVGLIVLITIALYFKFRKS